VEQDYLRRIVLRELDVPGGHAPALIDRTVRFALDIGYHVICEGILHAARYRPMLTALHAAHRGTTSVFYLSASLEETLRRHCGRPQHSEFSTDDMRSWYIDHDLLGLPRIAEPAALDRHEISRSALFGAKMCIWERSCRS